MSKLIPIHLFLLGSFLSGASLANPPSQADPRALLFQGRALQQARQPDQAEAIYRQLLQLAPESSEAHLRLAESLLEQGKLLEGVPIAKRATELDPLNRDAWAIRGILEFARWERDPGNLADARKILSKACELSPQDAELWARRAHMLDRSPEAQGSQEEALECWLRLGRLRPSYTPAWDRAAALATKLKRYEAKREAILALCEKDPEPRNLGLLQRLAMEQAEMGYLGHAEESFRLLARQLPQESSIWENIAMIQLRTKHFKEARISLDIVETMQATPRVQYNLAITLMHLGRYAEAEPRWKRLLDENRGLTEDTKLMPGVRFHFAECLLFQNKAQDLIPRLQAWPETRKDPGLATLLIVALIQNQQYKEALLELRDASQGNPKLEFARLAPSLLNPSLGERLSGQPSAGTQNQLKRASALVLARSLASLDRWEEAQAQLQEAKTLGEGKEAQLDLLNLQADVLDNLGRPLEAIQTLREAHHQAKEDASIQNNLGYLLLEHTDRIDEALMLIEKAVKNQPKNPSFLDSLGWALFKKGRTQEALKPLQQSLELAPDSAESRRHLGEIFFKLGRTEEAIEQWERALAYVIPERDKLEKRLQEARQALAKALREKTPEVLPSTPDEEEE